MIGRPRPLILAWTSVLLVACLGVCGWSLHPEHVSRWMFVVFFLPAMWGFLEIMQSGDFRCEKQAIMNWHRSVIAATGLMIGVRVAVQLAISADFLGADWAPASKRIQIIIFGVGLAIWGNYLPKLLSPWSPQDEPFDWQQVHRFVGWAASLSGIALAIVGLSFSWEAAGPASRSITIAFVLLGLGRKLTSVLAYSRRQPPPTPQQEAS